MIKPHPPTEPPQIVNEPRPAFPEQKQASPGIEAELTPRPRYLASNYKAAGKLEGKVALVTGGDSGVGRAVCVLYAREGADVCFTYLPQEQVDALETFRAVEAEGHRCLMLTGNLADPTFCRQVVERTVHEFGHLDILVSNAAHQNRKQSLDEITDEEWQRTFAVNMDAYFYLCQAAVPHMKPGSAIIATSSVVSLEGEGSLVDYGATKGAINAFTKCLAKMLIDKGIRVNAVALGPVWTPLNPADEGTTPQQIAHFGESALYGRPAQPEEVAPMYVFLASEADSSYITGAILDETGGRG